MYTGKFIFAQAMDYLPQYTLRRYILRYNGNQNIKSFSCQDQYRCMAFYSADLPRKFARHRSLSKWILVIQIIDSPLSFSL